MALDLTKFMQLCAQLTRIDFYGEGTFGPPWVYPPTSDAVVQAVERGSIWLPPAYRNGYAAPLIDNIQHVLLQTRGKLEPYAGAVYQYADDSPVAAPLHRFLAVISDLYRSFLDRSARAKLSVPLVTQLPPLALFESASGGTGPYTIPSDDVRYYFPSDIGLVSLPSKLQDHPVIWACLAHETGGHDVLHADYDLLSELRQGVWQAFGLQPPDGPLDPHVTLQPAQLSALLWGHWMDEAASDVYGLLNIGPHFATNLAAYFSASATVANSSAGAGQPNLSVDCWEYDPYGLSFQMDEHPSDVLRLHLAIGVIEKLVGLKKETRDAYVQDIQALSNAAAPDKDRPVELRGYVQYLTTQGGLEWFPVRERRPLADLRESARLAGNYIACTAPAALGGVAVQAIETWDDWDEEKATGIADALKSQRRVDGMGDDAQLLAGATAALLDDPTLYEPISRLLELALDRSFREDPIWRPPTPAAPSASSLDGRRVFAPTRFRGQG